MRRIGKEDRTEQRKKDKAKNPPAKNKKKRDRGTKREKQSVKEYAGNDTRD